VSRQSSGPFRVAEPDVGDPHDTGEADAAVHDEEFPVGTVVEAMQRIPTERVKLLDLDAGVDHLLEQIGFHLSRPDPVEHHVHANVGPRSLGQRIGKRAADVSWPVDVGLERDRAFRAGDRVEHGGEIWSPLYSGVIVLPSSSDGPSRTPIVCVNSGWATAYWWSILRVIFSPDVMFMTRIATNSAISAARTASIRPHLLA
jgi:hypothetical protein